MPLITAVRTESTFCSIEMLLAVDDLLPPWSPRGVEIRGHAETLAAGSLEMIQDGFPVQIRIHAHHIVGWGINTDAFHPLSRSVKA